MGEKVCPLMGVAFDCRRCHLYVEYGEERRCVFEVLALKVEQAFLALVESNRILEQLNADLRGVLGEINEAVWKLEEKER